MVSHSAASAGFVLALDLDGDGVAHDRVGGLSDNVRS
jgi:hypothetical protein